MTQDQLGELMDTDRANIGKYENGMRCEMSYKMIRRFARALGIPASMLVGKDDDLGEILVTAASLNEENRSVALTTSKSSPVYADGNRPTSGCLNVLKHPNTAEESGQNRKRVKDDSPQPKTGQIVREKKRWSLYNSYSRRTERSSSPGDFTRQEHIANREYVPAG